MSLPKLFERIFWHNNTTPAINETNLNAMSKGLSDVDDRLISLGGLIMETVPEIQQDMEILGPAVESIDDNVAAAQASAETAEEQALKSEGFAVGEQDGVPVGSDSEYFENNAEYFANIANPPIRVTKDFAPIISITDAINKKARDVRIKVEPVQDLHGYTHPWPGGCGKNLLPNNMTSSGIITVNEDGSIKINGTTSSEDERNIFNGTLLSGPGSYIASANFPSYDNAMYMGIRITNASSQNRYLGVRTSDVAIELASGEYISRVYLHIDADKTVNNVTIYPMIRLASVADGTYERYSNICPIIGWSQIKTTRASRQLLPFPFSGSDYAPISWGDNGEVIINGSANAAKTASMVTIGDAFAPPSGTYTFSWGISSPDARFVIDARKGTTWVKTITSAYNQSEYTFDLDYDGYDRIEIYVYVKGNVNFDNVVAYPMLERGAHASSWEPYQGQNYIINLGGTYYLCQYDATNGVLTALWGMKTINDLSLTYGGVYFYTTISDKGYGITNIISSCYATVNTGASDMPSGSIKGNGGNNVVYIMDKRFTSEADLKADVGTETIIYQLATPQTIQLTPQQIELLFGDNTLFADTGDIYLEYDASGIIHIADGKLDIDVFKAVTAASSDFADFKTRVAAL